MLVATLELTLCLRVGVLSLLTSVASYLESLVHVIATEENSRDTPRPRECEGLNSCSGNFIRRSYYTVSMFNDEEINIIPLLHATVPHALLRYLY